MDVGTTVVHQDSDENLFVGQIVGRDFAMRPVWRASKKKGGLMRRTPDGALSDRALDSDDVMTTEKVETGLFTVFATYRDGHQRLLTLDPSELFEAPPFDAKGPPWSHSVDGEKRSLGDDENND